MGTPTLPSALSSFTSEFDMGSGGTYSLMSSGKLVVHSRFKCIQIDCRQFVLPLKKRTSDKVYRLPDSSVYPNILKYMIKPHEQLVRVSSTPYNAYTSRLSTS